MGEAAPENSQTAEKFAALLEENRRLAQRYLNFEEASRQKIERLEATNYRLAQGDTDMRLLIEEAAFGFLLLDRNLCLVNANRTLLDLLGYSLPDLSGLDFRQVVYVEKLPAFMVLVDSVGRDGSARADVDLVDHGGEIVTCRLSASNWKDDKGENLGYFLLVLDVTHELRAAERIDRLRAAAGENEKTREIILDIVGREIRTPVNSIAGMIRMLIDTSLDDRQRELAGVIHSSAASLARLVDNLIDMAGADASDAKMRPVPVRVSSLCHGVIRFFMTRAEEKGVVLEAAVAPGVPEAIIGDAARLRRVLAHLLDNAIKFTDAGKITISVDAVGDRLRFMVSDTGCGLYQGAGEEIFNDFATTGSADTRRHGGLGVGLSICRRLVSMMGGKIGFESTPGRGCEFHFTIPLAPVAPETAPSECEGAPQPAAMRLPPLSILVADANPVALRVVNAVLGLDGHRVVAADSGMEAVERARSDTFDVFLFDMQLPDLDGAATLRLIRDDQETSGRKRVPAIALVAAAALNAPDRYREVGFAELVAKPVRPVDLMAAVSAATGVEALRTTAPTAPTPYSAMASGASIRRIDGRQFANISEIMQDEQFVGILRVFIEDSVPDIVHLVDMASSSDPDRARIAFAANKARGLVGYLGLSSLADILGEIEREARERTGERPLPALAQELQTITDDTLEELKRIAPHVFVTFSGSDNWSADDKK